MNPEETSRHGITSLRLALILGVGLIVAISACGFILSETERAVVLRFGKPVRTLGHPGFFLKFPAPIDSVVRMDRRLQHADIRISETLTTDQRNVIVPMFFTWRIDDPLKFHTSVKDVETANRKLDALVTSSRNSVLGRHEFSDLFSAGKSLESIEQEIFNLAAPDATSQLGIALLSTGITQIQLPQANTESVFRRMRAERKREATQFRAEGRAKAGEMKAEADRESTGLIAEAKSEAEKIRGDAEAKAAGIYAQAHGKDPDFYRFLRELQSLRTIIDKNTTLVLDTSIAPLHWLKSTEDSPPPSTAPRPRESLTDAASTLPTRD